jgi:hypothetical protein
MQMLVPLNPACAAVVQQLAEEGADAFYLGYAGAQAWGSEVTNRRQGNDASFPDVRSACEAIGEIERTGARIWVTLNEHFYVPQAFEGVLDDAGRLLDAGATGFIVADVGLLLRLRERHRKVRITVSTGARVSNRSAVRFYRELGACQFVLPRHLTPAQMHEIVSAHADLQFEVFVMNDRCPNIDGACRFVHGTIDQTEYLQACLHMSCPASPGALEPFGLTDCGACALYDLRRDRNVSMKICGRQKPAATILTDVRFLARVREVLTAGLTATDFARRCRNIYDEIYGAACGERCHYPATTEQV